MKKIGLALQIAYVVGVFITVAMLLYNEMTWSADSWGNLGKALVSLVILIYASLYTLILLIISICLWGFNRNSLDKDLTTLYWAMKLYGITFILQLLYLFSVGIKL